jgi:hypothetical protein
MYEKDEKKSKRVRAKRGEHNQCPLNFNGFLYYRKDAETVGLSLYSRQSVDDINKFIFSHLIKEVPDFMEFEGSLPCSQYFALDSILGHLISGHVVISCSSEICFNIILLYKPENPKLFLFLRHLNKTVSCVSYLCRSCYKYSLSQPLI